SSFHTSSRLSSDNDTNHYTTLAISSTASPAEIKRQFYSLSKTHHPDRNPDDPTASTRFVAISEAYHVLSVPEKRAQYDAHLSQTQGQGSRRWGAVWRGGEGDRPQGSYSSASFAGSRPASGLNKKRTTFRGPPPSFYKSGGYGKHGAKRGEYAYHQHEGERSAGQESYGGFEGFGPGQTGQGNEVPHFDDKRHKKTHDHVNDHIYARRRRTRASDIPDDVDRGGQLASFVLVAGTVGVIAWSAKVLGEKTE
ncbi:DnaJ-domain-containing protein, partial [Byssothecium circinans]